MPSGIFRGETCYVLSTCRTFGRRQRTTTCPAVLSLKYELQGCVPMGGPVRLHYVQACV